MTLQETHEAPSSDGGAPRSVQVGLARMLAGGVIMDVTTAQEAQLAEEAGAVAVMALERVPADIRREGGVARMADVDRIVSIQEAVSIPVMAKVRIGHFAEAWVLEELAVDFIDESEVLTPADHAYHIDKRAFRVPFVCGATNLGEALRRIGEGAAMIRTKGEAGTGDVIEAVAHLRRVNAEIRRLQSAPPEERMTLAKELGAPFALVERTAELGRLPVPNFAAGGIATPADAALVMALGAEAVFVGSGVFKSADAARTAKAIVRATARWRDAEVLRDACREAGAPMTGMSSAELEPAQQLQNARMVSPAKVGVLALQGAFDAHIDMLASAGHPALAVRRAEELRELTHLVLPGGESTTMEHLLELFGLWEPIEELHRARRLALFGTCAGAILLGRAPRHAAERRPRRFGLIDVDVERNAYGRQVDSFTRDVHATPLGADLSAIFIRAPRITRVGAEVSVLAELDGAPIAVEADGVLLTTFHPELGTDSRLHLRFVEQTARGGS